MTGFPAAAVGMLELVDQLDVLVDRAPVFASYITRSLPRRDGDDRRLRPPIFTS